MKIHVAKPRRKGGGFLMQRKSVPGGGAVPSLSISRRGKSLAAGVGWDRREGTKPGGLSVEFHVTIPVLGS